MEVCRSWDFYVRCTNCGHLVSADPNLYFHIRWPDLLARLRCTRCKAQRASIQYHPAGPASQPTRSQQLPSQGQP